MLRHEVKVIPGYCWLHTNPKQNYGIASCRIVFYVIGPKGAVQFMLGTDWYPKAAKRHLSNFPRGSYDDEQPKAWDLGFHAKEPQYAGQSCIDDKCEFTEGKCYYDGSTLNAEGWIEGFVNGGTEWLWPRLEQYYNSVFEGAEYPDVTAIIKPHPGLKETV